MIRYLAHPRAAPFFQNGVLISNLIAMKFGLCLLMRMLYRPYLSKFKSDAKNAFLNKIDIINHT
jgi:hypothetical protein